MAANGCVRADAQYALHGVVHRAFVDDGMLFVGRVAVTLTLTREHTELWSHLYEATARRVPWTASSQEMQKTLERSLARFNTMAVPDVLAALDRAG